VKKIVCPLGVGSHLEYWGFAKKDILEMDWNDEVYWIEDFTIHCLPARHFSGRGIFPNKSLWASFLLQTKDFKIYVGGDSGYDTHYAAIGEKFGPIDLALLDSGQHDKNWQNAHMMTDEVIQASMDLRAKTLVPVHICKIALANHPWDEPLDELSRLTNGKNFSFLTPIIGEKIKLRSPNLGSNQWWGKVK
jgi:L-ascorbate metabolism protein UlaG (beta-lactamase superfamily)